MASQCGRTALGGQTPKSCSSLFDLKEVVQRQQLPPPPWWQQQQVAAPAVLLKQRSYLAEDRHREDDGILKEFCGECPCLGRDPVHTLLLEGLRVELGRTPLGREP